MINNSIITLDQDWAPSFVIEYVSDLLTRNKIKATWFITNDFPFLENLKKNPLFELGIHPNFTSNSTQGTNPNEIIKNLQKILPNAKTVRTHSLYQSTPLLQKIQKSGIENDVSILLTKTPNILPHFSQILKLYRFPFFWEDDEEMYTKSNWQNVKRSFNIEGLKIFNFHPIHIYLNSDNIDVYEKMKLEVKINQIDQENIQKFINKNNDGTKTVFNDLMSYLSDKETYTISELRKLYSSYF